MLSVAIIGAGNIGRIRSQVIQRCARSRVQIVADVDQGRAFDLARSVGAEATTDWRAAVQSPNVDLVVVCTPTKFHAEAVNAALTAGKHVLCEKPLARSSRETERNILIAEDESLVLKTGFNYRYMDHVCKAKQLLLAGALGPLQFFRCRFGHGGKPGYEKEWCTDLDLSGGGVLLEQGIHILDLVGHLLGEPTEVLASSSRLFWNFPDVEDNCFLLIRTEHLQTAQIHISWTQWINIFSLEIFGRDGYLHLTGRDGHYGPQRIVWGKRQANHSRPEEQTFEFPPENNSWQREWEDFLDAIRDNRQPMGNIDDSLKALRMVEAAYQSARENAWVKIAQIEEPAGRTR